MADENKQLRFAWHHHYAGKSAHSDIRAEIAGRDALIGWTILDAVVGAIDDPVETVKDAKKADRDSAAWKIDCRTGTFKQALRAVDKGSVPKEWLTVQGVTKPFPAPGSSRQHRGVFTIIDRGRIEHGAQKPKVHEYFLRGSKFKGRFVFANVSADVWAVTQPDDQRPIVLTTREVRRKWMPSLGSSALPASVRSVIPDKFSYWKATTIGEARKIRDALVEAIGKGEIEINFQKP